MLASWVLLAAALALLAAGTLYTEAVTLGGLHRELREAPSADRSIAVRTTVRPGDLEPADVAVAAVLADVLQPTGGELVRVLRSEPFAAVDADPETVTDLVVFGSYEAIERHATLLDGRWAEPGRTPLEATLSEPAAIALGLGAGDRVALVGRLHPSLVVEALVTGTWRPDPTDPYWLDEPLSLTGTAAGARYTTRGPLVVAREDLASGRLGDGIETEWRAIPEIDGFRPETLDVVAARATGLADRIEAAMPGTLGVSISTQLPRLLATVDRSVLVTQAGILLLLAQFGVLAGYAVVLVAALLVERRRAETALLRARGAALGHLVTMALGEALLLAVPAALVAPWLAVTLVATVRLNPAFEGVGLATPLPGQATFVVTALGFVLAVVALTLPTLSSGVSIASTRAAIGRQVGRTLPQRLGLDLALVLLAAVALFQLRFYGAPLTETARGSLGVDPLLVAAPAIGLLGGAVLAIRVVPRIAELGERLLVRGRGLVASLGGRQLARRPLRYTRAALLLILAAALGTFASAHAATWDRSQVDQAAYAAAADLRFEPGRRAGLPDWALGSAVRAIPGALAATPVVRQTVDLGSAVRGGPLLAVDAASMANVLAAPAFAGGEDIAPSPDVAALQRLATARPAAAGIDLPAGTRRVALDIDPQLAAVEGFQALPAGHEGATARLVVLDGDGRITRIDGPPGSMDVPTRLVVPLAVQGDAAAAPSVPLHIVAVELALDFGSSAEVLVMGRIDVTRLLASTDDAGDAWTDLGLSFVSPWRWFVDTGLGGSNRPYAPPNAPPQRLVIEPGDGRGRRTFRLAEWTRETPVVAAIASDAFLSAAAAREGERISASVVGVPIELDLVGRVPDFAPIEPDEPLVIVDGQSLDLARFRAGSTLAATDEWWIRTDPALDASVAAALDAPPIAASAVVSRADLLAGLTGDPLGLGVIGILGLGSLAALVFAAIGFVVSSTVAITERLGELALLKALGMSPRQLVVWLSMESVALLVVGLVAGAGLGLVLAWLALPFTTLTASGAPPVPAPVVVIPPEALLPLVVLAVVLLPATLLLVRRQLPAARTSTVLRARDE